MVRQVVSALEGRGLVPLFRIGQSMHHIILSTSDRHGLTSEPRVTVEFHPEEQLVRVAYSRANLYFAEPLTEERVAVSAAVPTTLAYLRRLWSDTKPSAPIPDALTTG